MRKLIITTISIITVCAAVSFLAGKAQAKPEEINYDHTYTFRDCGGFVACYEDDCSEPFLTTTVKVIDLTPLDRVMLRAGVEVTGARAMTRTLEAYCS